LFLSRRTKTIFATLTKIHSPQLSGWHFKFRKYLNFYCLDHLQDWKRIESLIHLKNAPGWGKSLRALAKSNKICLYVGKYLSVLTLTIYQISCEAIIRGGSITLVPLVSDVSPRSDFRFIKCFRWAENLRIYADYTRQSHQGQSQKGKQRKIWGRQSDLGCICYPAQESLSGLFQGA